MGAAAEASLQPLRKRENPRIRARALGLLSQIPGKEAKYFAAGLSDSDENIRIMAIRLTALAAKTRGFDTGELQENRGLLRALFQDTPAVRRQMAIALHGSQDIAKLWAALAMQHDGKDRWYLEALGIGAAGNEDECFNAWLAMVGDNWNTPAGRDIIWRMRSVKAAEYLGKIIQNPSIAPAERVRYVRSFDFLPKTQERTKALVQLATAGKVADNIAREALVRLKGTDLATNQEVAAALKTATENAHGTPQFIELVRDFGLKGQGSALLETALKLRSDAVAGDAVRLLLAEPDADKVINASLASPRANDTLNLLGTTGTSRGLERLAKIVRDAQQNPEVRREAVRALARTQAGAGTLVKISEQGQFPEELRLIAAGALAQVQYANLKDAIAKQFPMPNALGGQPLPPVSELVKLKGDVAKGRAVFERAESSCVTCHKVGDKGADFGPALTEIGTKLPKEAIYEAIINPNAGVSMGFETWQLALKDGGAAMGVLRSETADEVVLALPGGVTTKIAKGNIAKREKLTNSMMPSGLNQALSKDDLVDLVEYLASLKKS
jgi:putative heme-binding domain-containing protein